MSVVAFKPKKAERQCDQCGDEVKEGLFREELGEMRFFCSIGCMLEYFGE